MDPAPYLTRLATAFVCLITNLLAADRVTLTPSSFAQRMLIPEAASIVATA